MTGLHSERGFARQSYCGWSQSLNFSSKNHIKSDNIILFAVCMGKTSSLTFAKKQLSLYGGLKHCQNSFLSATLSLDRFRSLQVSAYQRGHVSKTCAVSEICTYIQIYLIAESQNLSHHQVKVNDRHHSFHKSCD